MNTVVGALQRFVGMGAGAPDQTARPSGRTLDSEMIFSEHEEVTASSSGVLHHATPERVRPRRRHAHVARSTGAAPHPASTDAISLRRRRRTANGPGPALTRRR